MASLTDFQYDRPWHLARFHVTTPTLPIQPINLGEGEICVERFDPGKGEWLTGPLRALEDLGPVPYGYVKYRTPFTFKGEARMFISTRADDAKKVFVNGKYVAEASNREKLTDFALANYAQAGSNIVEISYEQFGAPNFGENLGELKGLESAGIGADFPSAKGLESWQIQRYGALMRGREISPDAGTWTPARFQGDESSHPLVAAFTWCRAKFTLPSLDGAWRIPWKLMFDGDCDALIFLNGKFAGRYATNGPQREFYLPEPYLSPAVENTLMVLLAYTDQSHHLRKLQVAPYPEFSARRTRVEFEW